MRGLRHLGLGIDRLETDRGMRETETDRQRHTERQRQTDRKTDRKIETDGDRERQTEREESALRLTILNVHDCSMSLELVE